MAASPKPAQAYGDPPVKLALEPGNFADVVGMYVSGSPRGVSGFTPSGRAEQWYSALLETSPDFAPEVVRDLRHEVLDVQGKSRLFRWGGFVATRLASGLTAGWVGWTIGSHIWGTYLDDSRPIGGSYLANVWMPVEPGQQIFSDWTGSVTAPGWGLAGYNSQAPLGRRTDTGVCEIKLVGAGTPMYAPGWLSATFCGISKYQNYALFRDWSVVRCDLVPCPGINTVDYNGSGQPIAPTIAELEDSIEDELRGLGNPITNAMANHLDEPELFPDPRVVRTEQNHACDRAPGPAYMNPDGNDSPGEFAKYYPGPYAISDTPDGHEATPVYLHYGRATWGPSEHPNNHPYYPDDWTGWGYRHIVAKHGWSATDQAETQAALLEGTKSYNPVSGNWQYAIPVPGPLMR